MNSQTIDTAIAKRLVKGHMIRGASIIGASGGWSVVLKIGTEEMPLVTQRTDRPRLWSSLDSCVSYLKGELHIARFDLLDATHYNKVAIVGKMRMTPQNVCDAPMKRLLMIKALGKVSRLQWMIRVLLFHMK